MICVDQQSTMGSSRRFGTSSELRLQNIIRRSGREIDASGITSPAGGDRTTRFDYQIQDEQVRKEIDSKREVSRSKFSVFV